MAGGRDAQTTRCLWGGDRGPVYSVTSLVVLRISPKEVTAQFVNVMTNLLGEKRGLHCIGWD